uniref:probable purine permease 10 n=1 Tax=Erigeron canadensis TaxID=72917 RepID=UPI001CB9B370|nr:probable purine permease 10 [Erigeron canadensis]
MQEAQELATNTIGLADEDRPVESQNEATSSSMVVKKYKYWWIKIAVFTIFVLSGQSVAVMLGSLYFNEGGNSKWMATLVQTAGFPLQLPLLFMYLPSKTSPKQHQITTIQPPSRTTLFMLYMFLGIFLAADCMLYTLGLKFLPVSTYTLICATQLAFNALFSYFLNGQKLTPFITNSLVVLSFSSSLLVFQSDSEQSRKASRSKYIIGFVCTVAASAGYGLMLSVTQLAFKRILKSESYRVVFDVVLYQNMVASVVILMGLFASGEWNDIQGEMEGYKLGQVSYIMNLVWTAITWQVFSIGCVGLIFEVSSLFSNVISTLGIPIVPVLAVVFFHDKMNGVKVISMLLAIWGFISYVYQHYLDDLKEKGEAKIVNHEVDLVETRID